MNDVIVDLLTPSGMKMPSSKIPGDYTVREIIGELVDQLELQWNVNGQKVAYTMKWENQGSVLPEDQTLSQAGVTNGQTLRLYSPESNGPPPPPPRPIPVQQTGETVEVILTLKDLGEDIKETLRTDTPVRVLIQGIIKAHNLTERENNRPIIYKLFSKYRGTSDTLFLPLDKTLAQCGVPNGDRLFLQRENDAG